VNFDVDGDALKREHKAFLDAQVVPILRGANSICILRGEASHTGGDAHNLALSARRAENTRDYLTAHGAASSRVRVQFVGESLAGSFVGENDEARAVSILVARAAPLPRPTPPPAPAPVPKTTTKFRLRMLGAISAGIRVVQVDTIFFQIWAPSLSVTSFYEFTATGVGKGAGTPISATLEGPWNDFETTAPIETTDFAGPTRFTTAGGGPVSVNFLNMMSLPPGVATVPNPLSISTPLIRDVPHHGEDALQ
jgi:hypothetical protein